MWRDRKVEWGLAIGGAVYLGCLANVGINYADEGHAIDSATRILSGEMLLRDFADLISFLPYLLAGVFRLTGPDVVALRVAMIPVKLLASLMLYRAALRWMPSRWAMLPAVVTIAVSGPFLKAPLVAMFAATLLVGLRWAERPTRERALEAGGVVGCMSLLRPELTLFFGLCLLPWIVELKRQGQLPPAKPFLGMLGGVMGAGLTCVLLSAGPFDWGNWVSPVHVFSASGLQEAVMGRFDALPGRPFWHLPLLALHDYLYVLGGGFIGFRELLMALGGVGPPPVGIEGHLELLLVDVALAGLLLTFWQLRRRGSGQELLLGGMALAATIKFAARADFPHFVQSLPIFALATAAVLTRFSDDVSERPDWIRLLPAGAGLALFAAVLWHGTVNHGFYAGGAGVLRNREVRLELPGSGLWVSASEAEALNGLVRFVDTHRREGDTLMAYPYAPLLHTVLGIRPAICYSFLFLSHPWFGWLQNLQEVDAAQQARSRGMRWFVEALGSPEFTLTPVARAYSKFLCWVETEAKVVYENSRFRVRLLPD